MRVLSLVIVLVLAGCAAPAADPASEASSPNSTPTTASTATLTVVPADEAALPAWASAFQHHVTITVEGDVVTLRSDTVPRHDHGPFPQMGDSNGDGRPDNPNAVSAQSLVLRVPRTPTPGATPSALGLGPIGLAVSGSPFFDARNANGEDAVEVEVFDACNGHPEMRGMYHYHQWSNCYATEFAGEHSPIYGIALDGYLVHGRSDGSSAPTDLDACNGHTDSERGYHYHMTASAPYIFGCYHGTRVS